MLTRTNVTNIGDPFVVNNGEHYYMYGSMSIPWTQKVEFFLPA